MQSKKINMEDVGEVLLQRSSRARRINLSVRPFKGVRVAVPPGISFDQAEQFARQKAGWLKKRLEQVAIIEQQALETKDDSPPVDRREARNVLVRRLDELARRHGFTYNKVSVRKQKTRWGSCSVFNNINLNMNLVRLPAELMDYIILHELVHTRVKNHGPAFWAELNKYVDQAEQLRKELRRYGLFLK